MANVLVDLEIVLAVDISGSISTSEFNLQKQGYVDAFNDSSVYNAIAAGAIGKTAVTLMYWSSAQKVMVGWTLITGQASSEAFSDLIDATSRPSTGPPDNMGNQTGVGDAIDASVLLFGDGFTGTTKVIDVSGDGVANAGGTASTARDAALAAGIDRINGLAITIDDATLLQWYTDNVIGGTDSFAVEAIDFATYGAALLLKLQTELGPGAEGVDGTGNCAYVADGQVRKMVSTLSGLDHLEGLSIEVQMDGILPTDANDNLVTNAFTVSSGSITLPQKAAVVHAGLAYDGLVQLLKSSDGSIIGSGQTKMRRVYLTVVKFLQSRGLKVGPDESNLSPIFLDTPALPLFTGDKRKLPFAPWNDETEMVFKMEDPLPCQILSILLESEVEEKG